MAEDAMQGVDKSLTVGSSAFSNNGAIPRKFTCEGENVSPQLTVRGFPNTTRALALVVDDPDAPRGTFHHWTFWDLPVRQDGHEVTLDEDVRVTGLGATEGTNDFGNAGYGGPCPPSGTHRYRFKAFALREPLRLAPGAFPNEVLRALEGKVLAWGELVGTYQKSGAQGREAERPEARRR